MKALDFWLQDTKESEWKCDLNLCQMNEDTAVIDQPGVPQSIKMLENLPLIPGPWSPGHN